MRWTTSVLLLSTAAVLAGDPPETKELPKPPAGWKYVESKDETYQFLFPAQTPRSGTRDRTYRSGRLSFRVQVNYCVSRDGLTFAAEALNLAGIGVKGLGAKDILKIIVDAEKMDGYDVTEPVEGTVGKLTGNQFYASKGGEARRVMLIGGRGRTYILSVAGKDKANVGGEDADTFLGSLVLTPKPAVKTEPKTPAKPEAPAPTPGTEAAAEVVWTNDLTKMAFPDKPASGKIMGADFKVASAEYVPGFLTLRQGKGFFADAQVKVALSLKPGESIGGKTFEIGPRSDDVNKPSIFLSRLMPGEKVPKNEILQTGYALKLEFGPMEKGKLTGKIYVCTPDKNKSVVAGTFEATAK